MAASFILDSHIWLWMMYEGSRLSEETRRILTDTENLLYVSPLSVWEIELKRNVGHLVLSMPLLQSLEDFSLTTLDFEFEDALIVGNLPFHHRDPFDRGIVAQSIRHRIPLISYDEKLAAYQNEGLTLLGKK